MAHSYSGGILVDSGYRSTLKGLYAVGEAAGSLHGACRLAGNAATQAVLSGLLCAEAICAETLEPVDKELPMQYTSDAQVCRQYATKLEQLATSTLGVFRNGPAMVAALLELNHLLTLPELQKDSSTYHKAVVIHCLLTSALERRESRGTHMRTDYPSVDPSFARAKIVSRTGSNIG